MQISRRSTLKAIGGTFAAGALPVGFGRPARAATGTMVVAIEGAPNQLDPLRYLTNPGYRVIYNIFDTLIGVDYRGDGKLIPGLATSWRRVDNRTVEVKLRPNVSFHDGTKLIADDVVFSFSEARINTKGTPGYANAQQHLSTIERAVAVSEDTVRIISREPDPVLELRLSAWGSQIISKAAFEKAGGWDGFSQKPVGTGPYSAVSLRPDEVRLKAFANYWGGEPNVENLIFRGVPELSTRIAGLASGDFQLIADVPPDQFPAVTRNNNLEIVGGPIASMRVVKFDTRNALLKDPRMRQGLALAVDRQAIVRSLWQGQTDVPRSHQLQAYGSFYDPSVPVEAYDQRKARELIAASGYKGETIPYRIRANAYAAEVATAQVLVAMWGQVGVKIDLQIKETFGQMLEYPGTGMRNGVDPVLVNDPLFGMWRSYNESERDVWVNEAFYKLGHQLETEMDPAARKRAFQGMLKIFNEDPPAIILHRTGVFYAKPKSVKWNAFPHVYMDFRKDNASL